MKLRWNKPAFVHLVRIAILALIVVLVRLEYRDVVRRREAPKIELRQVRPVFPAAAALEPDSEQQRLRVLGEDGQRLGFVLQTSPASDNIIGFSGSTNLLIAFGIDERIAGVEILSSGDTREHLAQIVEDSHFLRALDSLTREEALATSFDAVTGATLTSLAIQASIAARLGDVTDRSLKFPDPPTISATRLLFPSAARLQAADNKPRFEVFDTNEKRLGWIIRTSPAADNLIGYQGPSDALIGFDAKSDAGEEAAQLGQVVGIALDATFDNEPYVNYVRDDDYFRKSFDGLKLEQLASADLFEMQVEGVSGATMTSMAVADGIIAAAKRQIEVETRPVAESSTAPWRPTGHDVGTVLIIGLGTAIGLSRWRANRRLSLAWKGVLIVYLGFVTGNLLSQAMFVGWAKNGVPITRALGLACLGAAAFLLPIFTKRNIYCTHLCPHGALQQLVKPKASRRLRLPLHVRRLLALIPAVLLAWCLLVAMNRWNYSLVDIEPFDAYLIRIAGAATLTIAVVGIVASRFVPMAYCRYGCPTGALLEFVRYHAKSNRWSRRDWLATGLLVLAIALRYSGN